MNNIPIRIQRKRTKGWRMPPNTKSVTRPGRWGNPFVVGEKIQMYTDKGSNRCIQDMENLLYLAGYPIYTNGTHLSLFMALNLYMRWILKTIGVRTIQSELRGKNLACFCPIIDDKGKPTLCHADVLLSIANSELQIEKGVVGEIMCNFNEKGVIYYF